jgi:response regulator of citrate/malate metabolism
MKLKRVLHIEDSIMMRKAVDFCLRDCIVATAEDVEYAIRILKHNDFDIILCAFYFDDGTGEDILNWLRVNRPDLVEKFVFVSGEHEVVKKHHRCLLKPFTPSKLKELVG